MVAGPVLFSRYAFMPNRLGYCGGPDNQALLEYGASGQVDQGLIELEQQFEGAYPYLALIAQANGIPDPLDARVVQAYWIGNSLLDRVNLGALYASLQERFRPRTPSNAWSWLASKVPAGARPHHSFHVLEIYPRVGLLQSGAKDRVVETMQQCLIRWGKVSAVLEGQLVVQAPTLVMESGQLCLTAPRQEMVTRWQDGLGFVQDVQEGDWVTIHWGWACDIVAPGEHARIERYTRWHLRLCNQTI